MGETIIRKCLKCDAENFREIFSYDYDFLINLHKQKPSWLREIGWSQNTTSTIVECMDCGIIYVRDVFTGFEQEKTELSDKEVAAKWDKFDDHKLFPWIEYKIRILYPLISLAIRDFSRDINVLDYGAGTGSYCNMMRAFGIRRVFAYEPYSAYHPKFYETYNFPGIIASRSWDEIVENGPFDIVICNGVFEHLLSPKEDIEHIYNSMTEGGYFYINNPFGNTNVKKEVKLLRNAKEVSKEMVISHYHPGHLNYLDSNKFKQYIESFHFKSIKIGKHYLIPPSDLNSFVRRNIASLLIYVGMWKKYSFFFKKNERKR